jgi:anti-sigma factor RsiW
MTGDTHNPMACAELVELLTAYLDDELDPDTRARFDIHLLGCDGCQNYLQQFRATVRTLGRIRHEDLDPVFRERLLNTFRNFR